jgi:hypothetical protein
MLKAAIISWDAEKARQFNIDLIVRFPVLQGNTLTVSGFDHEVKLLNYAIEYLADSADYIWFLTPDLEFIYEDTVDTMVAWMDKHPDVGVLCPNREGEPRFFAGRIPYDKYLQDNTAIVYRTSVGARFDPEFIFTGWNDLDFGEEVMHRGYKVQIEPRVSVRKHPTKYGSWSAFRRAYNARNRLLLEAKWYWVGRGDWAGVDAYNRRCKPDCRIPTMFELAWWPEDVLNRFADSVNHEQPRILLKDGQGTGNENWRFTI